MHWKTHQAAGETVAPAKRRLLLVLPDTEAAQELRSGLASVGLDWEILSASSGGNALQLVSQEQVDIVVADASTPGLAAIDLLDEIWRRHPRTLRFLLAGSADKELLLRCVCGCHRVLHHPVTPAELRDAITRGLELEVWLRNESLRNLVGRLRTFPTIPSLYGKVLKTMESPAVSSADIAEIVGRDLAMSSKVLQVVNSACYGLPRKINDLTEAITILGLETVRSLVLAIRTFTQLDRVKPLYFSIDRVWKHGLAVAHLAREITLLETNDPDLAGEAFTAGLFHDIGKVVMAANLLSHYEGAMSLARKRAIPLTEVEREVFGATHADVAAYLLALWGLPVGVVEAIALHHSPAERPAAGFGPLVAVHAANAIEHSLHPDKDGTPASVMDEEFLKKLNLTSKAERWRKMFSPSGSKKAFTVEDEAHPENPSAPLAPTPLPSRPFPAWLRFLFWAPSAAALALALLLGYHRFAGHAARPVPAPLNPVGRTRPNPPSSPVVPDAEPAESPAPSAAPPSTEPPATALLVEPSEFVGPAAPAPAAPTLVAAKPKASPPSFPSLSLQAIFYRRSNSVAVVNGRTLRPGDQIQGARLVSIDPAAVQFEFGGEFKTLLTGSSR